MKLHVIFDGSNTSYRANCVSELSTSRGERTSAIYGTLNIVHSTLEELSSRYKLPIQEVLFAWDKGKSERRKKLFPEYKSNRNKEQTPERKQWLKDLYTQMNILHDNLHLFGIKSFCEWGWEGDDIIYGFISSVRNNFPGDTIIVVSTDEDFHQLISSDVAIYSPIKNVVYSVDTYQKLVGIHPDLFLTYKILKGDTSDGIPGIPGIGEKTAKLLVNTYGDVSGLLKNRNELMKSKRIAKIFTAEGLSTLDRNNKLINLKDYVDLTSIQDELNSLITSSVAVDPFKARDFLAYYQLTSILMKFKRWFNLFKTLET